MKGFQEFAPSEPRDLIEGSKQGHVTILLDENLRGLEAGLEVDGCKAIAPPQELADEALKGKARGWAIRTKDSHDFIDGAVRYDYDVTGKPDCTNQTMRRISGAAWRSQIGTRPGNFRLKIRDDHRRG